MDTSWRVSSSASCAVCSHALPMASEVAKPVSHAFLGGPFAALLKRDEQLRRTLLLIAYAVLLEAAFGVLNSPRNHRSMLGDFHHAAPNANRIGRAAGYGGKERRTLCPFSNNSNRARIAK